METQIQKYEPSIVIELKNGRRLLTKATNRKSIEEFWNAKKIIQIEGVTVAYWMIACIEELSEDLDVLFGLDEETRNKALARFKTYETNLGRKPRREEKLVMLKKIINS